VKIFVGADPAHLLLGARLQNPSYQSSLRWVDCSAWADVGFTCVRLVLVVRYALGVCCVLLCVCVCGGGGGGGGVKKK
jgi:hypothetical protein